MKYLTLIKGGLAVLVIPIFAFAGQPAVAQQPACTDRATVVNRLAQEYSEAPVALGIANNGGVVEVFSSEEGKTWTIAVTMPNGLTCLIAAGVNWETIQPPELKKGDLT